MYTEIGKKKYPDRAGLISAIPGHSEHQLGLAIDLYSSELPDLVGDSTVVFNSDFDETSEGKWLAQNAHKYGFTMSYPPRCHGLDGSSLRTLALPLRWCGTGTYLYASGQFLTKFLMESRTSPACVP